MKLDGFDGRRVTVTCDSGKKAAGMLNGKDTSSMLTGPDENGPSNPVSAFLQARRRLGNLGMRWQKDLVKTTLGERCDDPGQLPKDCSWVLSLGRGKRSGADLLWPFDDAHGRFFRTTTRPGPSAAV